MKFLDEIKEETIIITNNYGKINILNEHKLIPIKIMTLTEFIHKYIFSYDENAILYVINKLNVRYEIAKEYIENIYYILDTTLDNEKIKILKELKEELDTNNLLEYNNSFIEYVKRTPIIIYNIDIDSYTKKIFKDLNYNIVTNEYKNYEHKIYEFDTMEEEVTYIAKDISEKISNGIKLENIKLTNIDEEYHNIINRIFNLHNLKININYKRNITSYNAVKNFLDEYKNTNNSIEEIINKLDKNDEIIKELIKIINRNLKYNNKELIIYKIENSNIYTPNYQNDIEVIDYLDYIPKEDEYIYLLGFNEGSIPHNYQDTTYLNDEIKKKIGLDDTKTINKYITDKTKKVINNTQNIIITYKLSFGNKKYYPSSLAKNYSTERPSINYNKTYSELYDKLTLAKEYDNYIKFGHKSDLLDILNANYKIDYNTYSNKYTKVNRKQNYLNLSYSKMQVYNKCAFSYYLKYILKLDIFEENFSTVIGNMAHYVMENCLKNNTDNIEIYINEFIKDKTFTKKELFFLEKYKSSVKELIEEIKKEKKYTSLDNAMYEKKIDIDYGNNIHFNGIIDKILYHKENNQTYIALVDYKTGNDEISLKYLEHGINIQLPIYLYLSTKLDFINPMYCGFYLQKLNIIDKDYRLLGYSNNDKEILKYLDNNYDNSEIIKSLKTVKDGSFSKHSKVLTDEEIENIKEQTEIIINKTITNITNNEFQINPKITNNKNISCEYCKYSDICFKRKEDEINIDNIVAGGED